MGLPLMGGSLRLRRAWMAALVLTSSLVLSSAEAAGPLPLTCDGVGTIDVTPTPNWSGLGNDWEWDVHLAGTCNGDFGGPYRMTADGIGYSFNFGTCDPAFVSEGLLDQAILHVTVTITSVSTGAVRSYDEQWTATVVTGPPVGIFLITGEHGTKAHGTGEWMTRTGLLCRSSAATSRWVQMPV